MPRLTSTQRAITQSAYRLQPLPTVSVSVMSYRYEPRTLIGGPSSGRKSKLVTKDTGK